jgi:AbiV family abortive infection protein
VPHRHHAHRLRGDGLALEAAITRNVASPGTTGDKNAHVMRNAKRLLDDAKLLNEHVRHASAFALAVLALEEIGKAILRKWDLSDHASGHPHKQLAVSSLLFVDALFREAQRQAGRGMVHPSKPRSLSPDALEAQLKATMESEAGRFSQVVDAKAIERLKQFALYYDGVLEDVGFRPDQFGRPSVGRIFRMCSLALTAIEDDETVPGAKALILEGAKVMFLAKKDVLLPERQTRRKRC